MTTVTTLTERYQDVMRRVREATARAGREGEPIHVVAVTKFAEIHDIRELIALGHQDFGENRVQQLTQRAAVIQEGLERRRAMRETAGDDDPNAVRWHMIGHLQRNKVAKCVPHVRLIHSVDSLRLVEELQAYAVKRDIDVDVLVQVNCSGEASKFGCAVPAAQHLCEQIDLTGNIHIRGLMTIAPYAQDPEDARPTFSRCRELFDDIAKLDLGDGRFNILSMGMTGDFETAIDCGANVLRIGSAIFGTKPVEDDEPE
jgi:pyridoxal phosphate enzyme (YggS family)